MKSMDTIIAIGQRRPDKDDEDVMVFGRF